MEEVSDYGSRNDELIKKLQAAATQEERSKLYGELYENNRGLIRRICYRWKSAKISSQTREGTETYTGILEFSDLLQEAYFFLVKTANRYADATQAEREAARFSTYLSKALDWGFIRYFGGTHRYINDERRIVRLNETLEHKDEEGSERLELVADESQDVEGSVINRIYSEEAERAFLDIIKRYPPTVREILSRRVILGHTLKTIGAALGKDKERIRQIYEEGLRRLQSSDIKNRLAEIEQDDEDTSIAYKTSGFKFWKEHGMSSVELIAIKHETRQQRQEQRTRRNELRAKKDIAAYLEEVLTLTGTAQAQRRAELEPIFQKLPDRLNKIATARYLWGKTWEETAAELGVSLSTVIAYRPKIYSHIDREGLLQI